MNAHNPGNIDQAKKEHQDYKYLVKRNKKKGLAESRSVQRAAQVILFSNTEDPNQRPFRDLRGTIKCNMRASMQDLFTQGSRGAFHFRSHDKYATL